MTFFRSPVSRRAIAAAVLALTAGSLLPMTAGAQQAAFPTKPVRIITPFPVGGGPDGVARLVADKLSRAWGQPVVVENRPGGNGFIAIDAFKRGAKDGHDIVVLDNVHLAAYPALFKKLPYDASKDFDALLPLFKTYFFFTVATGSKYKTIGDLVADAKANPGKLDYGSWSVGNPVHLGSELFESATGTQMEHVIYKETTQLYTSVATGELAFALGSSATAGPLQRANKLRFLAAAAPARVAAFPDVPTVAESGLPQYNVASWNGLAAPAGTPGPVIDKLNAAIREAVQSPDVQRRLQALGVRAQASTPQELGRLLSSEIQRWRGVIVAAKIPQQ